MKLKPLLLPVILLGGLGSIYLLPQAGKVAGTAIRMELPSYEAGWRFEKIQPTEAEVKTLAKDTEFSKAICITPRPGEYTMEGLIIPDRIDLSIVLSGYDLNNSIHRPERCMPAQGHDILSGSDVTIVTEGGRTFTARRLLSTQRSELAKQQKMQCITYYFFVGHNRIEHDHIRRTLTDMKDRLLLGMDQRWAYASVSMWFGRMPWNPDVEITEEEVDRKMARFLSEFADKQINWQQVQP